MPEAGEPVPQLKLTVGSTRVSLSAVRSLLSKYSPRNPVPPVNAVSSSPSKASSSSTAQEATPLPKIAAANMREILVLVRRMAHSLLLRLVPNPIDQHPGGEVAREGRWQPVWVNGEVCY